MGVKSNENKTVKWNDGRFMPFKGDRPLRDNPVVSRELYS